MRFTRIVTAMALTAAAGVSSASPTDLGSGTGKLRLLAQSRQELFRDPGGPGTYDLSSSVTSDLASRPERNVWLSHGKDNNSPSAETAATIFELFTKNSPTDWSTDYEFTLTKTTDVYVNVDTHWGKITNGSYNGTLTVTAVPEPASYALLLAGAGLLGFMGMRRRRG